MGVSFKKRAPRCINVIRQLAARATKQPIENVVLDESVNVYVWQKGIKVPPRKIRVVIDHIQTEGEQGENRVEVTLAEDKDNSVFTTSKQFKGQRIERENE